MTGTHEGRVKGTVNGTLSGTVESESALPLHRNYPNPYTNTSGLDLGTSLRAANGLQATTITLLILRPDWPAADTQAALARDPRPWRTVVAAALACALDPAIEHPSRIETTNTPAIAAAGPTPVPPSLAELRRTQRRLEDDDCGHGDIRERCALCRHHRSAEEPA